MATNAREAVDAARAIGFPVVVKQSFAWSGRGVAICADEAAVAEAVARISRRRFGALRDALERLLGRDWNPTEARFEVQRCIDEIPAMYAVAALGGEVLAGVAGRKKCFSPTTGSSATVALGDHAEMAEASTRLIKALGASGSLPRFRDRRGDRPRLSDRVRSAPGPNHPPAPLAGVDLCGALAAELKGERPAEPLRATRDAESVLFPQEWLRRGEGPEIGRLYRDAPFDDPRCRLHAEAGQAPLIAIRAANAAGRGATEALEPAAFARERPRLRFHLRPGRSCAEWADWGAAPGASGGRFRQMGEEVGRRHRRSSLNAVASAIRLKRVKGSEPRSAFPRRMASCREAGSRSARSSGATAAEISLVACAGG